MTIATHQLLQPVPVGTLPIFLSADHASALLPTELDQQWLSQNDRLSHVTIDIGVAEVVRMVSAQLAAPALLPTYSKMVCDLNREPTHPENIRPHYDGTDVPFNENLSAAAIAARLENYFYPYHQALSNAVQQLKAQHGAAALFVSIHSFTPALKVNPSPRPWEIGVLWRQDSTTAERAATWLEQNTSYIIGRNEPYSAITYPGYTLAEHIEQHNICYVLLEIRDDLISTPHGQLKLAYVVSDLVKALCN